MIKLSNGGHENIAIRLYTKGKNLRISLSNEVVDSEKNKTICYIRTYSEIDINERNMASRGRIFKTMALHNELGKKGEQLAVELLLEKDYKILERNYRFQKAEVDIIALKNEVLAVVEVKTRSTVDFGNPQDFVKPKQIQNLVKAVDEYINVKDLNVEVRFDIIAIVKQGKDFHIEHLEDAFYHF